MTDHALVCCAAHLGRINLEGSRLVFVGSPLATYGFSALALGELVADKLPFIPSRTSPGPLFGRVVLGALSGATLCAATGGSLASGAILGGAGGAIGAFAGYQARARLVRPSLPDWGVPCRKITSRLAVAFSWFRDFDRECMIGTSRVGPGLTQPFARRPDRERPISAAGLASPSHPRLW
jgi:uncharacterized membrane protein